MSGTTGNLFRKDFKTWPLDDRVGKTFCKRCAKCCSEFFRVNIICLAPQALNALSIAQVWHDVLLVLGTYFHDHNTHSSHNLVITFFGNSPFNVRNVVHSCFIKRYRSSQHFKWKWRRRTATFPVSQRICAVDTCLVLFQLRYKIGILLTVCCTQGQEEESDDGQQENS